MVQQLLEDSKTLSNKALYKKTADNLMQAVHKGLGGSSFDDNDSRAKLIKAFKVNIEAFSYAKNLTQFKYIKDHLFDSKGALASADTVKKIVFDSGEIFNKRYLTVEHQFATQSAIMAHKWDTLDSEYLEFSTVGDNRVRPEHQVFDKFTALKSDGIWKRLYTPLSWNCRCTIIPGIAKGVSKEYNSEWANKVVDPLVKGTIFDNNVGITQQIFTKEHPYFAVLGAASIPFLFHKKDENLINRYADIIFKPVKVKNGVLEKFTTGKQNPQESAKNEAALRILAKNGGHYRMLPVIDDGNKNPDALNLKTGLLVDVKVPITQNGKNIIQSSLKEANKQGVQEVIIHLNKEPDSYRSMYGAALNTFKQGRAKNIKEITIIYPNGIVKHYDTKRFKIKKV